MKCDDAVALMVDAGEAGPGCEPAGPLAAHMAGCPACAAAWAEFASGGAIPERLRNSYMGVAAPAGLDSRIRKAVAEAGRAPGPSFWPLLRRLVPAAAAITAAAMAALYLARDVRTPAGTAVVNGNELVSMPQMTSGDAVSEASTAAELETAAEDLLSGKFSPEELDALSPFVDGEIYDLVEDMDDGTLEVFRKLLERRTAKSKSG